METNLLHAKKNTQHEQSLHLKLDICKLSPILWQSFVRHLASIDRLKPFGPLGIKKVYPTLRYIQYYPMWDMQYCCWQHINSAFKKNVTPCHNASMLARAIWDSGKREAAYLCELLLFKSFLLNNDQFVKTKEFRQNCSIAIKLNQFTQDSPNHSIRSPDMGVRELIINSH